MNNTIDIRSMGILLEAVEPTKKNKDLSNFSCSWWAWKPIVKLLSLEDKFSTELVMSLSHNSCKTVNFKHAKKIAHFLKLKLLNLEDNKNYLTLDGFCTINPIDQYRTKGCVSGENFIKAVDNDHVWVVHKDKILNLINFLNSSRGFTIY